MIIKFNTFTDFYYAFKRLNKEDVGMIVLNSEALLYEDLGLNLFLSEPHQSHKKRVQAYSNVGGYQLYWGASYYSNLDAENIYYKQDESNSSKGYAKYKNAEGLEAQCAQFEHGAKQKFETYIEEVEKQKSDIKYMRCCIREHPRMFIKAAYVDPTM